MTSMESRTSTTGAIEACNFLPARPVDWERDFGIVSVDGLDVM